MSHSTYWQEPFFYPRQPEVAPQLPPQRRTRGGSTTPTVCLTCRDFPECLFARQLLIWPRPSKGPRTRFRWTCLATKEQRCAGVNPGRSQKLKLPTHKPRFFAERLGKERSRFPSRLPVGWAGPASAREFPELGHMIHFFLSHKRGPTSPRYETHAKEIACK